MGEEDKLSSKSKVDFSRLPPCNDSMSAHSDRVNYRLFHFKKSHVPLYDCPRPHDGHGWIKDNDFLEPQWSRGSILPPSMVDILEKSDVDEESEEQEDGLDDYDELMAFLDEDNE